MKPLLLGALLAGAFFAGLEAASSATAMEAVTAAETLAAGAWAVVAGMGSDAQAVGHRLLVGVHELYESLGSR